MMNSAKAKYKFSKLEKNMNKTIIVTFFLQFLLALIGALTGSIQSEEAQGELSYLGKDDKKKADGFVMLVLQQIGTWILIFTNFVPISLLVTVELVKFWQVMFMEADATMFDEEQDAPAKGNSSNLNEELGQVEYVFSDKTGTLTCNIMEFKKFSAGNKAYGTNVIPTTPQESNVCFHDPELEKDLNKRGTEQNEALTRVMYFLACCHTIVIDDKKGTYNAASPDELALVNAAKQFGFEFKGFDASENMLIHNKIENKTVKYQLLNICEFDSTRKRMSVIFRDPQGRIVLMCKGADSIIKERLNQKSLNGSVLKNTQDYVDQYAEGGLRTLFLAERIIPEAEYNKWSQKAKQARLEIKNRDEAVAAVDELIEVDLELVGCTAIEDRLQDEVAETIQFLKKAGIKVWVLTGDKIETAINIGYSAGLLDNQMA